LLSIFKFPGEMNPEVFTVFGYFSGEKMRRKITFIVPPEGGKLWFLAKFFDFLMNFVECFASITNIIHKVLFCVLAQVYILPRLENLSVLFELEPSAIETSD